MLTGAWKSWTQPRPQWGKKGTKKRWRTGSIEETERQGVHSMGHCLQTGWIKSTSTPPPSQNYPCTCPPATTTHPPTPTLPVLDKQVWYSVDSGNTQFEVERYGKHQQKREPRNRWLLAWQTTKASLSCVFFFFALSVTSANLTPPLTSICQVNHKTLSYLSHLFTFHQWFICKKRKNPKYLHPLISVFSYHILVDLWLWWSGGQSRDFICMTWAVCLPGLSTLAVPKQLINRSFRTVCLALNL